MISLRSASSPLLEPQAIIGYSVMRLAERLEVIVLVVV